MRVTSKIVFPAPIRLKPNVNNGTMKRHYLCLPMRSIVKRTLVLFAFFAISQAYAQQDAQFSQYLFNQLYLNPATAGINKEWTEVNFIHRSQWLGYSPTFDQGGAPNTQVLSISTPLTKYRIGLGFHFVNDQLGPLRNNELQLSLAYHLPLPNDATLSFGARGGLYNHMVDFNQLRFVDPTDPLNIGGKQSEFSQDFAVGVHYRSKKYFGGVGINHLQRSSFSYGFDDLFFNALQRHMNVMAGVNFEINRYFTLTPSVLMKTDFNQWSVEGGIMGTYDEKINFGLSMRETEAAIAMIGLRLTKDNRLHLGYAFDYTLQARNAKEATSHEILLSYRLPVIKFYEPSVIRTPRFRH